MLPNAQLVYQIVWPCLAEQYLCMPQRRPWMQELCKNCPRMGCSMVRTASYWTTGISNPISKSWLALSDKAHACSPSKIHVCLGETLSIPKSCLKNCTRHANPSSMSVYDAHVCVKNGLKIMPNLGWPYLTKHCLFMPRGRPWIQELYKASWSFEHVHEQVACLLDRHTCNPERP